MKTCVVDASVAAKWLLPSVGEDFLPEANHLLSLHVRRNLLLIAPDVIRAEVGNVLWKAVRRRRTSQSHAENSLAQFMDLSIEIVSSEKLLATAFKIAVAYDRAFYDCLYVALAVSATAELITADERLANSLASRFPIRWLGAFHE